MIAPRYVGPSTTTRSPRSRKVLPTNSRASIPPLVIKQLAVGGPPALDGVEPPGDGVDRARQPLRGRVLERRRLAALGELREERRRRSRGNVSGSGKPPANEIRSGRPRKPSTKAIPSPTSPRVRAAKCASQRLVSGVTAIGRP